MQFSEAKALITVDAARRKGKAAEIKPAVDDFLDDVPSIETVIVVRNTGADVEMTEGRDVYYDEAIEAADEDCGRPARRRAPARHPLHLRLDGEAEGHPAHHWRLSTGAATHRLVFDLKAEEDVYWCGATSAPGPSATS